MSIPPGFDLVISKMLAVVQALAQAGPPDGFGDDDGGRVFNPRRNRADHMTDPLAIGAALFRDKGLQPSASLTEESIWLFGEQALSSFTKPANFRASVKSRSFPDGGLYIVASSELSQQMVIDAGPQGTGRSGHGHADALSIKLSFAGRRWLVDAGTGCYIGPADERNTFRGTRAHNTLTVDSLDQAQPEGPFAWSSIPETQADLWISGTSFTLFAGWHSGYERLAEPVRHRRFVFHLNSSFWLIRDVVEGSGSHLLETSWHFAPDVEVSQHGDGFLAVPGPGQASSHLTLIPVADSQWKSELLSEFISPAYGAKLTAPVVRCSARVALPAEHAALLIPAEGVAAAGEFFRDQHAKGNPGPEATYRYRSGETMHAIIFGPSRQTAWNFGPWTSDARFFYFRIKDRRVEHMVFCQGSFAQLRGESVISRETPVQWLEWTNREGQHRLTSSDEAAAGWFSEGVLSSEVVI